MSLFVLLVALAAPPSPSFVEACASAAEKAEPLKKAGHFAEAVPYVERCVVEACPKAVRDYCRMMKAEIDLAQPTIEVSVNDDHGQPLKAARLRIDGVEKPWPASVSVDPGLHQVRVELESYQPHEESLGLRAGEKRRPVMVVLKPISVAPVDPPPEAPPLVVVAPKIEVRQPYPAWPMMISGIAATASWATFIGLGLQVKSELRTMQNNCAPMCDPDKTRALQLRAGFADGALAVGSLLTALTGYFVVRSVLEMPAPTTEPNSF